MKSKMKAFSGLIGLILFAAILSIWPPKEQHAQPAPALSPYLQPAPIILQDSLEQLQESNRIKDSIISARTRKIIGLSLQYQHVKKKGTTYKRQPAPQPCLPVNSAIIKTDSGTYQLPATQYGRIAIIDGGDLQRVFAAGQGDLPPEVTANGREQDNPGPWRRFKATISGIFKKKNQ